MAIVSINPATGEKLKEFSPFDDAEIAKRLKLAENASSKYRRTRFIDRSVLLEAVAELLFQEKKKFAEIITLEMGKLLRASVEEIEKCARGCRFYAENGERFLEDEPAQTDAAESYVQYQPLGPVLAIMPWNFPFWQVFRFAAPALMAGNVGLLKHASNVPQCALAIEEIFCRAGFADGVFQTLLIEPEQVEKVIANPRVKAVTLTGSEKAGSAVAGMAAHEIKKSVLELGGSDPFIVMPSANFESALNIAVKARTGSMALDFSTSQLFLLMCRKNRQPIAKRFSARSHLFSACAMPATRSSWQTTRHSVSPPARGQMIPKNKNFSLLSWKPEWSSSMQWSLLIRVCRLAV